VLRRLRQQIDAIDDELLGLLNKRARIALEIAHKKQQQALPVLDATREAQVIRRLGELNEGPLTAEAVARIYHAVIREMCALEQQHLRAA